MVTTVMLLALAAQLAQTESQGPTHAGLPHTLAGPQETSNSAPSYQVRQPPTSSASPRLKRADTDAEDSVDFGVVSLLAGGVFVGATTVSVAPSFLAGAGAYWALVLAVANVGLFLFYISLMAPPTATLFAALVLAAAVMVLVMVGPPASLLMAVGAVVASSFAVSLIAGNGFLRGMVGAIITGGFTVGGALAGSMIVLTALSIGTIVAIQTDSVGVAVPRQWELPVILGLSGAAIGFPALLAISLGTLASCASAIWILSFDPSAPSVDFNE